MSKLLSLKEWLTVSEAARHLSRIFNEEVAESDVLRLALDGQVRLSVHFVNRTRANPGKIVDAKEIEWTELPPIGDEKDSPPIRIPDGLRIDDERWIKLENKVVTLDGVWDLAMIGAEAIQIEDEYQWRTGGPSVTLVGIDGAFVEGQNGVICRLCESWDDNEHEPGSSAHIRKLEQDLVNAMTPEEANEIREKIASLPKVFREKMNAMEQQNRFYPAAGLPDDGVLVVRSKNLTAFVSSLDMKQPRVELENAAQSEPLSGEKLSTKERNSLLKIIAALLSVSGLKGETFKQAEGIVRAASEVGIKVSVNTVDKYLKEATSIQNEKLN